jgi:DNA-binding MarR family transcriptional regulator
MSLALDLGLFFRNSKTKLGLSLTQEAILYKLAFRVGTNTCTWIKQEPFAKECGIARQNLNVNLKKIEKTRILKSKTNKYDTRKNDYLFSDKIKNYHQLSTEDKRAVHKFFNDEYVESDAFLNKEQRKDKKKKPKKLSTDTVLSCDKSQDDLSHVSRNHDTISKDVSRNHDRYMSRNHDVSLSEKNPTDLDTPELEGNPLLSKATDENNNKSKTTMEKPVVFFENPQNQKPKATNLSRNASTYSMARTEPHSTVKFWGPGNEAWESYHS